MGRLREVHDFPEALMERVQLWALNRGDEDGNLSARRRREARGSAQRGGNGALRRQQCFDRGYIITLDSIAEGDVDRPDVQAATGEVLLGNLLLH